MADDVTLNAASGTFTAATDDIGSGRQVQLIKPVFGADGTGTMVTPDVGLPAGVASTVLSGSATSNNADIIASTDASGYQMGSVQLVGSFLSNAVVQGSNDGTNWIQLSTQDATSSGGAAPVNASFSSTSVVYVFAVITKYVRVRTTIYTSGTVTAYLRLYNGAAGGMMPSSMTVGAGNTSSFGDAVSVSYWTSIRSVQMGYNGVSYDRWRGAYNVATGDSGAKTSNFLGLPQTNYNARGAYIVLLVGATSGTFTTFQTGLQFSPDGGTTWLPFTDLGANLTTPANGNTIVWCVAPGAATIVPAASGGTAVATQYNYVNAALPRTWRFAITLAGTSPSLTVSSIQVAYIV